MGSQLCPGNISSFLYDQDLSLSKSDKGLHQNYQRLSIELIQKATNFERGSLEMHMHSGHPKASSQYDHNKPKIENQKNKVEKIQIQKQVEKISCQFELPDKTIFKGITINGIPNGYGEQYHSNGEVFCGIFVNGQKLGHGKCIFENLQSYQGDFSHNMMHGKGKYSFSNGDQYVGYFKDNMREGKGRYIPKQPNQNNVEYFEGQYKQNERNGQGLVKYTTGKQFKGIWKHGLLIRAK